MDARVDVFHGLSEPGSPVMARGEGDGHPEYRLDEKWARLALRRSGIVFFSSSSSSSGSRAASPRSFARLEFAGANIRLNEAGESSAKIRSRGTSPASIRMRLAN